MRAIPQQGIQHLDLFSGIGGFALAVDDVWPGSTHTFVEHDPFCQAVLRKNFPNSPIHGDIKQFSRASLADAYGQRFPETERRHVQVSDENRYHCDLVTGGFPCQPFSQAGKRKGTDDARHLWPEMLRVVREFRPTVVVGENVSGFTTWDQGSVFEQVCLDLEAEGYEVWPAMVPACAVNAPHRRDRIWIVAHRTGRRQRLGEPAGGATGEPEAQAGNANRDAADIIGAGLEGCEQDKAARHGRQRGGKLPDEAQRFQDWSRDWREVAAATCVRRVDDGLPKKLVELPDGTCISHAKWRQQALKAYGNSIVPQVAIQIMRSLKSTTITELD